MAMSEVAHLRETIMLETEAARLGLAGLASGTSRHDFIQARMAQIEQLVKAVDEDKERLLAHVEQEVTLLQEELKRLYKDDVVCHTTIQ